MSGIVFIATVRLNMQNCVLTNHGKHRKRHQINKSNLYKDYDKSVSSTKTAIAQLFDEHEAEA